MRLAYAFMTLVLASASFADVLVLRNGQVVNGTYLGGTARQVKMEVGNQIQTFDIGEVTTLSFSGSAQPGGQDTGSAAPPPQQPQYAQAPQPPDPQSAQGAGEGVELPAGTPLTVRLIDAIDSRKSSVGQTFNASLDEPVLINGNPVIPRGADVDCEAGG